MTEMWTIAEDDKTCAACSRTIEEGEEYLMRGVPVRCLCEDCAE